ncbi:MAG: hypothetical protein Q7K43_02980 [Candidatus Woesearchaeota archaeon]|nr:hypothetical protein [Candidatus Woesearchaeota archaeon]
MKNLHQWVILIGIIIALAIPIIATSQLNTGATEGDLAEIEYTIRLADGSVYATTNAELATQSNVSVFVHDSFKYLVGDNNEYPLDTVVLGMKKRQKISKDYTPVPLPPTQTVPRTKSIDRIISIPQKPILPLQMFTSLFGNALANDEVQNQDYFPWTYKVINVTEKGIKVEALAFAGQTYSLPGLPWSAYLTDITAGKMYLRQDAQPGQHLNTYLGDTEVVNVSEKHIIVQRNPVVDSLIETAQGTYYVVNVTEQDIYIRPARTFLEETNFTIELELVDLQKSVGKVKKR